jgi:hypothetical protein
MEFKCLLSPNPNCTTCILYEDLRGIFAAPPCTEFSLAKNARYRDFESAMETVAACMRIIWGAQIHTRLGFWALENPRGLLRRFLGVPKYTFEQWQFGEDRVKATDVWGYFNPPAPTCREKPEPKLRVHAADWTRLEYPPEYEEYIRQFHGNARRAAARAITPAGFADAFFRANSKGTLKGCERK